METRSRPARLRFEGVRGNQSRSAGGKVIVDPIEIIEYFLFFSLPLPSRNECQGGARGSYVCNSPCRLFGISDHIRGKFSGDVTHRNLVVEKKFAIFILVSTHSEFDDIVASALRCSDGCLFCCLSIYGGTSGYLDHAEFYLYRHFCTCKYEYLIERGFDLIFCEIDTNSGQGCMRVLLFSCF